MITSEHIDKAISYARYRDMIDALLTEGKTTGEDHSEAMISYTKLNVHRMQRLEKQAVVKPEFAEKLRQPKKKEIWLVLTEAWCGDAAQSVPVIQKMAAESPDVSLKVLLRDENLDVMDQYLTNGGRSIPKVVCLDAETLEEKWNWGPRPAPSQVLYMSMKDDESLTFDERAAKLHGWYAKDKAETLQQEIMNLVLKEEVNTP